MPYADTLKQKAYQRAWSHRRTKKNPMDRRSSVTWLELISEQYFQSQKTWDDCVNQGKSLAVMRKVDRIKIAGLAIRACTIRRGGDHRSEAYEKGEFGQSLLAYAQAINVNYKTMIEWIRIKRLVLDKLPAGTEEIDYACARMAVSYKSDDPVGLYERFRNMTGGERLAMNYLKTLKSAEYFYIEQGGYKYLTETDKTKAMKILTRLVDWIGE